MAQSALDNPERPATRRSAIRPEAVGAPSSREMPWSEEAEQHVIACCLLDGHDTIARCMEARITELSFFSAANRLIFKTIIDLYQKSPPVTLEILAEELKTRRQLDAVGGIPYLIQVTGRIPTAAHAGYFIEKVREKFLLRELIKTATGAVEQCYSFTGGLEEFVDRVEQEMFKVTQDRVSDSAEEIKESMKAANQVIAKLLMKKGELTGVTSGFKDLDQMTFGFQKQEMIVVAARPSMGKTSFALNIAEAASLPKKGEPIATLIFSLEMSASQLALRMLCSRARVNLKLLRDGLVSRDGQEVNALGKTAEEFKTAPILIDDSSSLTIMEMRAKARRIYARRKLGLIIVDYLQLLNGSDSKMPREQQVAEVSRGLKAMAKELDLPVIVLSQLNRSSEKENRTPRLSDLRESGSIEQDADVVIMLSRPKDKDSDDRFQTATNMADLIVAKQRNGPVGDLKLTFIQEITRFENFTP